MAAKRREGKAPKTIHNYLGLLHSIFAFAQKRGLGEHNPVAEADRPTRSGSDPDIRFLDDAELERPARGRSHDAVAAPSGCST